MMDPAAIEVVIVERKPHLGMGKMVGVARVAGSGIASSLKTLVCISVVGGGGRQIGDLRALLARLFG